MKLYSVENLKAHFIQERLNYLHMAAQTCLHSDIRMNAFTQPLHHMQIVTQSQFVLVGIQIFFSLTSCRTKAKEPSLNNYLLIAEMKDCFNGISTRLGLFYA